MTVTELKEVLSRVPDYHDERYEHLDQMIIPTHAPDVISPMTHPYPTTYTPKVELRVCRDYERKEWIIKVI